MIAKRVIFSGRVQGIGFRYTTKEIATGFDELRERFLDIEYDNERLRDKPEPLLRNLLQLSQHSGQLLRPAQTNDAGSDLEHRLLTAVGSERREEASDVIETGRVSWKLRDDDNLLVSRLESQLLRALDVAAKRLPPSTSSHPQNRSRRSLPRQARRRGN